MFKIYTKKGDNGTSSLFSSNKKFLKSRPVFNVLGTFDELNVFLGYLQSSRIKEIKNVCLKVQKDLFILGSYFSVKNKQEDLKRWVDRVKELEEVIDYFQKQIDPLSSFLIPGGSNESNQLHTARVVCRRLERLVVDYIGRKKEYLFIVEYLNRLSDLFFVMARYSNKRLGYKDMVWEKEDSSSTFQR